MYIMKTKFVLKSQIKITKNLKSVPNCLAYISGPVDIMVIDKTDSWDKISFSVRHSLSENLPPSNRTVLETVRINHAGLLKKSKCPR